MEILIVHRDKLFDDSKIKEKFPKIKINKIWKNKLAKEDLTKVDFIVALGGDGTVLSASHFTNEIPILGVNSNIERSEGALTTITYAQLNKKIKQIIDKKFKIKEYTRAKVSLYLKNKNTETEQALNEVFFGNKNPHHTTNYLIEHKTKKEKQRSSGILISTGTGSTAWYKTAGGKPFNRSKKQLRFKIRELYKGRIHKPTIEKGKIKNKEKITITSKMNHAILAIDSIRTYSLHKGDKVEISIGKPIKVIQ